ncbi:hypothetical protein [Orbus mooreae]|uniref:hypothetical protein n=1 Tax=Orbus mooreae TaxID=3074107 RepID=UPI00370D5DFA
MVFSDWVFVANKDEITDENKPFIMTIDLNGSGDVALSFYCDFFFIALIKDRINDRDAGNWKDVIFRVDKNKPKTIPFLMTKFGYATKDKSEIFSTIKTGNKLLTRFKFQDETKTYSFSLNGLTRAYNKLQQECKNK